MYQEDLGLRQVAKKDGELSSFPSWPAVDLSSGPGEGSAGPSCVRRDGCWVVLALISSCPKCREQWEGGRRGNGGEGVGVSRKRGTKEPSAVCHLRMTDLLPHTFLSSLVLQLWALKSALWAQMLGFSSPLLATLWRALHTRVPILWLCCWIE